MNSKLILLGLFGAFVALRAAQTNAPAPLGSPNPKPLVGANLFDDPVVAEGKGVKIRQSQVDEAFVSFKASRAAAGETVPEAAAKKIKAQILDKLIATALCYNRAIPADKEAGKATVTKFMADMIAKMPSETAFRNRLIAEGTTYDQFYSQLLEQGVVKAVIDRELRASINITPEQVRKFYDENPDKFMQPEQARVAHVLLSTKNLETGAALSPEAQAAKKEKIQKILARARAGEDFAKLITEFSEDVKQPKGEYTFARGQMPPEFEAAAWSLKVGQVSDVVTTIYGYHILKLMEKIPPKKVDFEKVSERIKESLLNEAVQKALPDYILRLQKEAQVKIEE